VKKVNELLDMENDDQAISILRHYNWSQRRIEEQWFDQME